MLTTYHLYVSPNVSTAQYRVELPIASTRARPLRGMLLTKVWIFQEGSVAIDFGLQLPVASRSLTEGPIPPNHDQFRPKYVRLSSYPDDRGPIHADDDLFMEVSIHYTSPIGSGIIISQ